MSNVQSPKSNLQLATKVLDFGLWTLDFRPWTFDLGLVSAADDIATGKRLGGLGGG